MTYSEIEKRIFELNKNISRKIRKYGRKSKEVRLIIRKNLDKARSLAQATKNTNEHEFVVSFFTTWTAYLEGVFDEFISVNLPIPAYINRRKQIKSNLEKLLKEMSDELKKPLDKMIPAIKVEIPEPSLSFDVHFSPHGAEYKAPLYLWGHTKISSRHLEIQFYQRWVEKGLELLGYSSESPILNIYKRREHYFILSRMKKEPALVGEEVLKWKL